MNRWSKKDCQKSTGQITDTVREPETVYRPVPFWSLNDILEPEVMHRQMRMMAQAGLGGAFMHARGGLRTKYMSEEWMSALRAAADAAAQDGVGAWLYDENGWPSGFADGEVTACGEEYRQKHLIHKKITAEQTEQQHLLVAYTKDGDRIVTYAPGEALPDGAELFGIFYGVNQYYSDVLSRKAVAKFIEVTHERYKKEFGDRFGDSIPGIFTDEPQHSTSGFPYSFELEEEFQRLCGYSVIKHLPAVFTDGFFEDIGLDCAAVRFDYRKTVSHMLTYNFTKQIYDWCEENNLASTGHLVAEESIASQLACTGGVMTSYEFMHIPGIDWLGRSVGMVTTAKQLSSAAGQLDKRLCISETFGCSGWGVSFEDLKWIAEYQYVLGVNHMCQHLEWYSMRGARKRDYPPTLFYQQPWWSKYKLFCDYFARLSKISAENTLLCETLVIHTLHSGWCGGDIGALDRSLDTVQSLLIGAHIEYELGDETIIARHGSVENSSLRVGASRYGTVVVPLSYSLDATTLALLLEFARAGGDVVFYGEMPGRVDGRLNAQAYNELRALASVYGEYDELISHVSSRRRFISASENGAESGGVMTRVMKNSDGGLFIFAVNPLRDKGGDFRLEVCGEYLVRTLELTEGTVHAAEYECENGITVIPLTLHPAQSQMLLLSPQPRSLELGEATVLMQDKNVLTVDYLDYSVNGGDFVCGVPAIELQEKLVARAEEAELVLRYRFTVSPDYASQRTKEIYFACEDYEKYEFRLNGREYTFRDDGSWTDDCIHYSDISSNIIPGGNVMELRTVFKLSADTARLLKGENVHECVKNNITFDTEIESVYILGDFAVTTENVEKSGEVYHVNTTFLISKAGEKTDAYDTVGSGYPFYGGTMKLTWTPHLRLTQGSRYYLNLGKKPDCAVVQIAVNGKCAKNVMWYPYGADITQLLEDGENTVQLTLYGTGRNTFGPHHHITGEPFFVGPATFTKHRGWTDGALAHDRVWTDSYCFTRFGLRAPVRIEVK